MATRKPKPTVRLTHPSGKFTVDVQPARAAILEERGYTPTTAKPAAKPAPKAKAED
jgi:hypothetical protein